mmetsp:Transcript_20920/g.38019  ORF Transcript_20920/g.38019 Transcript_20920/m.38019 type:complete len:80 (-) Transcript_20920:49-288(-)
MNERQYFRVVVELTMRDYFSSIHTTSTVFIPLLNLSHHPTDDSHLGRAAELMPPPASRTYSFLSRCHLVCWDDIYLSLL